MLPLKRFRSFISEQLLFDSSNRILLVVSGGKDSVLMAHLFNAAGYNFGIAHCNFRLRGRESDADEEFVTDLAKRLGVPFYSGSFDTAVYASQKKISVQMAARDLRYDWFEKIRKEFGYDFIAIGHHQNDSVETVLLNLVRGTGISGLHGIFPGRNKLIRPLLFLTRDEIDEIIEAEKILYREDSSNSSVKYLRNKIRKQVIPVLKEINPQLEQTFEANSRRFREVEEFLDEQVKITRIKLFEEQSNGQIFIPLSKIKAITHQKLLLFELLKPFGFTEAVLDDLAGSFDKHSGKLFQSSSHQLLLDRNKLILSVIEAEIFTEVLIHKNGDDGIWQGHRFICRSVLKEDVQMVAGPSVAFIDSGKLIFPLTIRAWKRADSFYPIGMKGKKKLSDYFISLKIPLTQKSHIPILCNGNGDIIWIAGYRLDERYKIKPQTKKVTIFELKK